MAHIFVCLFANDTVRVGVANSTGTFRQWRNRHGQFIPVAGFQSEPAVFTSVTGLALPSELRLRDAASRFGGAFITGSALNLARSEIRHLGADGAVLLRRWGDAVIAARAFDSLEDRDVSDIAAQVRLLKVH